MIYPQTQLSDEERTTFPVSPWKCGYLGLLPKDIRGLIKPMCDYTHEYFDKRQWVDNKLYILRSKIVCRRILRNHDVIVSKTHFWPPWHGGSIRRVEFGEFYTAEWYSAENECKLRYIMYNCSGNRLTSHQWSTDSVIDANMLTSLLKDQTDAERKITQANVLFSANSQPIEECADVYVLPPPPPPPPPPCAENCTCSACYDDELNCDDDMGFGLFD